MNFRPNVYTGGPAPVLDSVLDEARFGQPNGIVSPPTRARYCERLSPTPNLLPLDLLPLGCLALTAAIVGLLGKDGAVLFAKLLETTDRVRDPGEMAGFRGTNYRSEATSQIPNQNFSPLLGVLGIVVALL
jgi:hypothetical protein